MDKTIAEVLAGKNLAERKPHCYTLEAYEENTVFIPSDITEDMVDLVAWKLSGSAEPGGTDSEELQGWLLKLGDHSKTIVLVWNHSWNG